jgi:hypothetical protein
MSMISRNTTWIHRSTESLDIVVGTCTMTQNREETAGQWKHPHTYVQSPKNKKELVKHPHVQSPKNKEKPDQLSIHTGNAISKYLVETAKHLFIDSETCTCVETYHTRTWKTCDLQQRDWQERQLWPGLQSRNHIGNWQAIYHHIWAALTIHLGVAAQDEG